MHNDQVYDEATYIFFYHYMHMMHYFCYFWKSVDFYSLYMDCKHVLFSKS